MRDINEGFPADSIPHTEYYDYQSDSELEDELSEDEGKARGNDHPKGSPKDASQNHRGVL